MQTGWRDPRIEAHSLFASKEDWHTNTSLSETRISDPQTDACDFASVRGSDPPRRLVDSQSVPPKAAQGSRGRNSVRPNRRRFGWGGWERPAGPRSNVRSRFTVTRVTARWSGEHRPTSTQAVPMSVVHRLVPESNTPAPLAVV